MSNYKKISMPIEAYNNFKLTQKRMSDEYKFIYGKQRNIPLTKIIILKSKQPVYIGDKELSKIAILKRKGKVLLI
jgi:hypothetical protein